MAEVYLAEQKSLGRQVAVKVLQPALAKDATYVQRFLNEAARCGGAGRRPHRADPRSGRVPRDPVYRSGIRRREESRTSAAARRTLAPRLVLDVLRQVASALAKADEMSIVHRDLKPENILLSHSGEVKVADFGLARVPKGDAKTLTQVGVAMGTPLYMSPEQIEGRPVDVRSDIYSLGVTCYHLLTGAPPHGGETALAIALQHLNSPPRPLENVRNDVPKGLARVVHRMMAKKPEQRFQTPVELLHELRQLASEAAAEGWGEGPDQWSLAQWIASAEGRGQSAAQLTQLMRDNSRLEPRRPSWTYGVFATIAALGLGAMLSEATRPRPYLEGAPTIEVPPRDSAWAQLLHAKMFPSEQTWQAVAQNFPNDNAHILDLATQGLIRYYLLVSEEWSKADLLLRDFRDRCASGDAPDSLKAFTYASLCIAAQKLGDEAAARAAAGALAPEWRTELSRRDHQLYELLKASLDALE